MKELRVLLEGLGYKKVRTYIQSGNCVFDSSVQNANKISAQIKETIQSQFGYDVVVLTLSGKGFEQAIRQNPYPQAQGDPKSVHFYFLSEPAGKADLMALEELKTASEEFALTDSVFYLFAPDGIGRSKLAEKVERKLGVQTTARNYRSVYKIAELAGL